MADKLYVAMKFAVIDSRDQSEAGSAAMEDASGKSASDSFVKTEPDPAHSERQSLSKPSSPDHGVSSAMVVSPEQPRRSRASKNKQKHNESESRRRDRMRAAFTALKTSSHCEKKDRIAILSCAVDRLEVASIRIRQLDCDRNALIGQLTAANQQIARFIAARPAQTLVTEEALHRPPLLTTAQQQHQSLSLNSPPIACLPCALICLDGRFLDQNNALLSLLNYLYDWFLGHTIFAITPQSELLSTFYALKQLLAGDIDCYENDRRIIACDGRTVACHLLVGIVKQSGTEQPEYFTVILAPHDGHFVRQSEGADQAASGAMPSVSTDSLSSPLPAYPASSAVPSLGSALPSQPPLRHRPRVTHRLRPQPISLIHGSSSLSLASPTSYAITVHPSTASLPVNPLADQLQHARFSPHSSPQPYDASHLPSSYRVKPHL